jgi:CheY-like chemotaxis protein
VRAAVRPVRSVLLVEDDRDNRESITDALRSNGFGVHPLSSVAEALEIVDDPGCPALILLDLPPRELDGGALLAALAIRPDRERFGVIVISADPEAIALRSRPSVVEVLRKPFGLEKLLAAVRRHA